MKFTRSFRVVSSLLVFSILSAPLANIGYAQSLNFNKETRAPVREYISKCNTFLTPADSGAKNNKVDDGMGTIIAASLDPSVVEASLRQAIAENAPGYFRNAQLSLTGVGMKNADEKRAAFEAMLTRNGWADLGIQVKVFSVPQYVVEARAMSTVQDLWEAVRYYPPDLFGRDNRDYQTPLLAEIKQGLAATALVETLNAVFIQVYTKANGIETSTALTVLGVHFAVLAAYTVFQKTLTNWIVRTGAHTKWAKKTLGITKNMLASLPFVVNFYLAGQWDRMVADSAARSALATVGTESLTFLLSQGPTLLIQGICYNMLIANGVWRWAFSQQGEEKQNLARAAGNWVAAPFQVFIAAFLTVASFNLHPFFQQAIGGASLDLNMGQVMLAGFTTAGMIFFDQMFKHKPELFDFSLRWYKSASNWWTRTTTKITASWKKS